MARWGLVLLLGLKFFALHEMAEQMIPLVLVVSHSLSRFGAISFVYTHEYVQDDLQSKAKPLAIRMSTADFLLVGILPVCCRDLCFLPAFSIDACAASDRTLVVGGKLFVCRIGGYTGDCLGRDATGARGDLLFGHRGAGVERGEIECSMQWQAEFHRLAPLELVRYC